MEIGDRLPNKEAVVSRSRAITFGALQHDALAAAECLTELGIGPGDRVGVCMEKSVDQVVAILGVLCANAVLVPVLPRLKPANIEHIINDSGMAALITDAGRMKEVSAFADRTKLITGHGEIVDDLPNLAYMQRHIRSSRLFDRIGVDNAAIIYSSGSMGRPKGILIAHRNLADGAEIVSQYLGTREDDRIACVLSFNFDYGLNQIWQALLKGATLYLHDFLLPNDLFSLLNEQAITALPLMPVIITQMFDRRLASAKQAYDLSSVRYVCSSGGRLAQTMLDDLARAFPKADIYSMFGLTEAFRSTFLPPDKLVGRSTSIGKAIPDVQILVLDEHGRECAPHVVGELVHRGACVSKGYWRDPENTARVFRTHPDYPGETLVFSGDNVYLDDEGYLYFVSRRDEMIKTQGYRVSPTEVEIEIAGHPEIQGAVAFGVTNIEVGEDIVCAYTSNSGEPLAERSLRQYLKNKLPRHMVPTYLVHFHDFPITGNDGKIDRKEVKNAARDCLGLTAPSVPL
jgi:amino acid adenylation domain-containing protein